MTPDEVLAVARAGQRHAKESCSRSANGQRIHDSVRDDLARFGHKTMSSYLREMWHVLRRPAATARQPGAHGRDEIVSLRG
jgi:hypothetical protein